MLGGEIALTDAIGPTVPVILVLALLAWLGRRPGFFGPVRPDRAARAVRSAGYAVACLCLLPQMIEDATGLLQPIHAGRAFALTVTLCAAAVRGDDRAHLPPGGRRTRRRSRDRPRRGAGGVRRCFRLNAPERHWPTGSPGMAAGSRSSCSARPQLPRWWPARRTLRADQAVMAALCAGTVAALSVALLGLNAIALFPERVPDARGPP